MYFTYGSLQKRSQKNNMKFNKCVHVICMRQDFSCTMQEQRAAMQFTAMQFTAMAAEPVRDGNDRNHDEFVMEHIAYRARGCAMVNHHVT